MKPIRKFAQGTVAKISPLNNQHLRDINRWDCINRDDCLIAFIRYKAIPCKGCLDYREDPDMEEKLLRDLMHNKKFHEFSEMVYGRF